MPADLHEQVLATVRYFDVQDHPVTLLEVWKYLMAGACALRASAHEVALVLENELAGKVEAVDGFYFLPGRSSLVTQRLRNNFYATPRLKRASRYLKLVRHVPFIRAVALTGSEAIANSKLGSDIDLMIITEPGRMWLGRLAITAYLQLTGLRRHGTHVADRFCLNHYVAGQHRLSTDHNVYTAVEYTSLIPYFGGSAIYEFQSANLDWISTHLSQPYFVRYQTPQQSWFARSIGSVLSGSLGSWLESATGKLQTRRIQLQDYITVTSDELSFHPGSKGQQVLARIKQSHEYPLTTSNRSYRLKAERGQLT